ncbi:carbamoyltransferase family protein [Christiangramia forsetii]|uniref:O-carbamoyltransferase n=2 Tax=Christiangramia forsetii TaxID=411153 RepID=A0M693_CHRFK|nr:carbamoyltransferase [Christiangramia forsetii]GGG31046.1 carbamoyltransferase [Christiangramia forsetii]CAL68138.1 O-carbamoyltransferase [Christiangramia forsetii KT0803]
MAEIILGISAFFHDSAAALVVDGKIIAAAQEERFSRIKNDSAFPSAAIKYVLEEAGVHPEEVTQIAFYEKPLLKFERLLETYHAFAPNGLRSFLKAMPVWLKDKLFFRRMINSELKALGFPRLKLLFPEHHLSHAASAFYPSSFEEAAILTIDGVGEWANMTIARGSGNKIKILKEQHFPHSLGLFYSAITYYLGFEVNSGEYKVMGLAAYGDPEAEETKVFIKKLFDEIVDLREDGSFLLNMEYFRFATHLTMTNDKKWSALFGVFRRGKEDKLQQLHANLAFAAQKVLEKIVLRLARTALNLTGSKNLVLAGGVALNGVANGKIMEIEGLSELWIPPAAGDSGGALGAALATWHISLNNEREPISEDAMQGSYLGPGYSNEQIGSMISKYTGLNFRYLEETSLLEETAKAIENGLIVGWFQGRMEFGPRALGNRSILGDARNPEMQRKINQKIKFRESFRPFAPSVLEDDVSEYFDLSSCSPYMLLVREVKAAYKNENLNKSLGFMERLDEKRSAIPAVTHVDYTARIQTVSKKTNLRYWKLLNTLKERTGDGIVINTSFNIKDEPIVCSPQDAIDCFLKTEMDMLVLGNYVLYKEK